MLSQKGEVVVEVQEQADVQLLIKSEMAEIRPLSKTSGPDACILLYETAGNRADTKFDRTGTPTGEPKPQPLTHNFNTNLEP